MIISAAKCQHRLHVQSSAGPNFRTYRVVSSGGDVSAILQIMGLHEAIGNESPVETERTWKDECGTAQLYRYEHFRDGSQWAPPLQVSRETLERIQVGGSLQHMFEELPTWDP